MVIFHALQLAWYTELQEAKRTAASRSADRLLRRRDQAEIGELSGKTWGNKDPGSARGFASCTDASSLFD